MTELKSQYQLRMEERDRRICEEFEKLTAGHRNKTVVTHHLCKKYGIKSPTTIFNIRKRNQK